MKMMQPALDNKALIKSRITTLLMEDVGQKTWRDLTAHLKSPHAIQRKISMTVECLLRGYKAQTLFPNIAAGYLNFKEKVAQLEARSATFVATRLKKLEGYENTLRARERAKAEKEVHAQGKAWLKKNLAKLERITDGQQEKWERIDEIVQKWRTARRAITDPAQLVKIATNRSVERLKTRYKYGNLQNGDHHCPHVTGQSRDERIEYRKEEHDLAFKAAFGRQSVVRARLSELHHRPGVLDENEKAEMRKLSLKVLPKKKSAVKHKPYTVVLQKGLYANSGLMDYLSTGTRYEKSAE